MASKMANKQTRATKTKYIDTLDQGARARYLQKIAVVGVDPYEVEKEKMSDDADKLPPICYYDIVNYLVNTRSAYTMAELRGLKSMDAYNQCFNGFVKDVRTLHANNKVLVTGRVRHSQKMNETPLRPWIISCKDGVVDSAHCDCMAGLGEVCSHVGALLYWVDSTYRANAAMTVTQKKASWPVPSSLHKVEYAEVRDIDFTSPAMKKKKFEGVVKGGEAQQPSCSVLKTPSFPDPADEEMDILKQKIAVVGSKPALLAVTAGFQDKYVPEILKEGCLPVSLGTLRHAKYEAMGRNDLINVCRTLYGTLFITAEQSANAERLTTEQSKCKVWHALRHGRITASRMKSVCVGNPKAPVKSTVSNICGGKKNFSTEATRWGCEHERVALDQYTKSVAAEHRRLIVQKCGLVVSTECPHIGASPDAFVSCDCCGEGVVEIKCPFCIRATTIKANLECLDFMDSDGQLKPEHQYGYQVQTQLLASNRSYCDFVVWTEADVSIQRITVDQKLRDKIIDKSKQYFIEVILPELTGSLFTRGLATL